MDTALNADLLSDLCQAAGLPLPQREQIRVWSMSGVERLTFPNGTTTVFKYATEPFTREDQALRLATRHGLPVPEVIASTVTGGWLGMLLEDLGPTFRDADDRDGVAAAVVLHRADSAAELPILDEEALRALPNRALRHLHGLQEAGRWQNTTAIGEALTRIADAAEQRAGGTRIAPYGWVHSEFHPTSIHIGERGRHLLDFARAFTGPGLLDLASWYGTVDEPEPARVRTLIESYVDAGGHPDALAERGGLQAEAWALGWHRIWAVEWFMEQAICWINDPDTDPAYVKVVHRHLDDAERLLEA
ncbi:phosphotransferase [Actinoallomurus purpureus]|uniref:phosphotransferase n=1 Tax=Actinoallomurus purpureus TaxID=478114 RepID=UPI002092EB42|nr:phosphotransferase [Actinoallomurus purpureus]MCO6011062.1 phosphotransferase [Actinoallomurus purpureus]